MANGITLPWELTARARETKGHSASQCARARCRLAGVGTAGVEASQLHPTAECRPHPLLPTAIPRSRMPTGKMALRLSRCHSRLGPTRADAELAPCGACDGSANALSLARSSDETRGTNCSAAGWLVWRRHKGIEAGRHGLYGM